MDKGDLMNFDKKPFQKIDKIEKEEELSIPVEILIPEWHGKPYICDNFKFNSLKEKNRIIEELKKEIEKERKEGRFKGSGGNNDGFNIDFLVDDKEIKMSFVADIPNFSFTDLTQKTPVTEDLGEEKKAFTKRHEDAHGVFKSDYNDLEKIGKGKVFVDEFIALLKKNNLWERQTRHVLENWKLINLGFSYNEEMLNLEKRINDLLRSNSLDIDKLFDIVKNEFGQEQLDEFKKSIIIEIDGEAHGYKDRKVINLIKRAQVNIAGEEFLHRNAPMEA